MANFCWNMLGHVSRRKKAFSAGMVPGQGHSILKIHHFLCTQTVEEAFLRTFHLINSTHFIDGVCTQKMMNFQNRVPLPRDHTS